jgi:anaerobic C4-dicarboxylate transporter
MLLVLVLMLSLLVMCSHRPCQFVVVNVLYKSCQSVAASVYGVVWDGDTVFRYSAPVVSRGKNRGNSRVPNLMRLIPES